MAESILTDDDLQAIKTNMERLDEAKAQIRQAESAGLDMSAQKKSVEEAYTQLRKIRQSYFPGK